MEAEATEDARDGVILSQVAKRCVQVALQALPRTDPEPHLAHVGVRQVGQIADADALFFDGTLWDDDEMIRTGTGVKTGRRMGHVPISGPEGSIAGLAGLKAAKTFIHINNTNPVLNEDSEAHQYLTDNDIELAYDGMHITL